MADLVEPENVRDELGRDESHGERDADDAQHEEGAYARLQGVRHQASHRSTAAY